MNFCMNTRSLNNLPGEPEDMMLYEAIRNILKTQQMEDNK